jgi:uncharacterized membrane protein
LSIPQRHRPDKRSAQVAILYPSRTALADALRRLIAAGIALDGASDHGVGNALTYAIATKTASNSIATGRKPSGRARRTEGLRCSRGDWT